MTSSAPHTPATPGKGGQLPIPFVEFVALIAGAMALTALSIDLMLPALPLIAESLHIANPNDRQLIISSFTLGIGLGALVYGPLSDRFGRKPVLCVSIAFFLIASLLCTFAPTFEIMLAGRFAAGLFIASNRVVTVSIVRDGFSGDAMARVMSLIFIMFMIVPVVAPSIGQLLLMVAPWRAIFGLLTLFAGLLLVWALVRLPETLKPEHRTGIRVVDLMETFRRVMTHRISLGHTLAGGVIGASITAFILSIQQILFDVFHAGDSFALLFAGIAMWMALGSYCNSRFVRRFGARRMSRFALLLFIGVAALRSLIAGTGHETLLTFGVGHAASMFFLSMIGSNLNAVAMEPFARGAGFASSAQTFLNMTLSVLLGAFVGAQFNGTTLPLTLGYLGFGVGAVLLILWAEKGRLFAEPRIEEV